MNCPCYVAVSTNDQLLVANYGHHCITIFTLDGSYVGKYGTQGTGKGKLSFPTGITFDVHGFILVTEAKNNCISIFSKDGVFIHSYGELKALIMVGSHFLLEWLLVQLVTFISVIGATRGSKSFPLT